MCHFVHASNINYGHLKSTRPVAHKLEVVEQDMGVVYVWVCQKLGMLMYKMFGFLFHSYLHNYIHTTHIFKHVNSNW